MYLTSDQVEELISQNQYQFKGNKYQSRCISGHFENNNNLPALALPGGDIGEVVIALAASKQYAFEFESKKAIKILKEIVETGNKPSFQHSFPNGAKQCRYLHLLLQNPELFLLNEPLIEEVFSTIEGSELAKNSMENNDEVYRENACIIFEGEQGLLPHFVFNGYDGSLNARVFIYHKTFVEQRRRLFVRKLIENTAVKLYDGLGPEYLLEVLNEVSDVHLFEFLNLIDNKMPIYFANVSSTGKIKIENLS